MNIFKKMWQGFFAHPQPLSIEQLNGWNVGLSQSGEAINDTNVLTLSTVWRCSFTTGWHGGIITGDGLSAG